MINMICDNCGAIIDDGEEYCPNCGMQLADLLPNPVRKKVHSKNYESPRPHNSRLVEKPIQKRYIEDSEPENPDYSQYDEENNYDEEYSNEYEDYRGGYEEEIPEESYKKSSGSELANIILLLFIALALGFIVGMLMFSESAQSILHIPGF